MAKVEPIEGFIVLYGDGSGNTMAEYCPTENAAVRMAIYTDGRIFQIGRENFLDWNLKLEADPNAG